MSEQDNNQGAPEVIAAITDASQETPKLVQPLYYMHSIDTGKRTKQPTALHTLPGVRGPALDR